MGTQLKLHSHQAFKISVLQKGLNFNTGHSKRDFLTTIAAIDEAIDEDDQIPQEEKNNH